MCPQLWNLCMIGNAFLPVMHPLRMKLDNGATYFPLEMVLFLGMCIDLTNVIQADALRYPMQLGSNHHYDLANFVFVPASQPVISHQSWAAVQILGQRLEAVHHSPVQPNCLQCCLLFGRITHPS